MASAIRDSFASRVGVRIRTARDAAKLTQDDLCKKIGIRDRQTLTAIEAGQRKVTAEELTKFMSALGRDLDYFTDPFRLEGEGNFSFRSRGVAKGVLDAFESTAGQWVAFWREQARNQKLETSPLRFQLTLSKNSTFEEAQCAGDTLAKQWGLGDVPASRLISTIEEKLSLLVLLVDMPEGISGAACQVTGADTILVNRKDSEGRRNFDLAHELFHVLTWTAIPPAHFDEEDVPGGKVNRVERLADYFASALLMPRNVVMPLWSARKEAGVDINEWFIAVAAQLHVTTWALGVRLKTLGLITDAEILKRDEEHLGGTIPAPFSRRFMERASQALEQADVSVMRLIKLLGTTGRGGLKELFKSQGLPEPVGV